MAAQTFKILLVGEDFRLLATRAAVLARTGANTVCCSPAEMLRDLRRETFDLVVLCHSVPEASANLVATTAREWWPGTRLLAVRSAFPQKAATAIACDAIIAADPADIMHEAMALLQKLPAKPNGEYRAAAVQAKHA